MQSKIYNQNTVVFLSDFLSHCIRLPLNLSFILQYMLLRDMLKNCERLIDEAQKKRREVPNWVHYKALLPEPIGLLDGITSTDASQWKRSFATGYGCRMEKNKGAEPEVSVAVVFLFSVWFPIYMEGIHEKIKMQAPKGTFGSMVRRKGFT